MHCITLVATGIYIFLQFGSVPALASGAVAMGFAVNILFVPYGILVVLSSLATLVELLAVILRVCNIRRLNANARVFHVIVSIA